MTIQIPDPREKVVAAPASRLFPALSTRSVVTGCLGVIILAALIGVLAGVRLLNPDESQATPTGAPALLGTVNRQPKPDCDPHQHANPARLRDPDDPGQDGNPYRAPRTRPVPILDPLAVEHPYPQPDPAAANRDSQSLNKNGSMDLRTGQ